MRGRLLRSRIALALEHDIVTNDLSSFCIWTSCSLPLDVDEDDDGGGGHDSLEGVDEAGWFDPWPTNDHWRRFRRQFRGVIDLRHLEARRTAKGGGGGGGGGGGKPRSVGVRLRPSWRRRECRTRS